MRLNSTNLQLATFFKKAARMMLLVAFFAIVALSSIGTKQAYAGPTLIKVMDANIYVIQERNNLSYYYPNCLDSSQPIRIQIRAWWNGKGLAARPAGTLLGTSDKFRYRINNRQWSEYRYTDQNGQVTLGPFSLPSGVSRLEIQYNNLFPQYLHKDEIEIEDHCDNQSSNTMMVSINGTSWQMCSQSSGTHLRECQKCLSVPGVWTAVGCIPTELDSMIEVLLRIGLLIGGGVSLLIILAGSFTLSTSQGDPKKTSEAKEMITSALIGLVFIIFSVSIMQLIGAQVLKIPGFAN